MSNTEKLNEALNCINSGAYANAMELLNPLLNEGNATAQYLMGIMYNNGHGVAKDLKKAEELYLASGNQGLGASYYLLGTMYFKELNELEKAYQSYIAGARLHDKSCINNGKYLLQNKLGVSVTKEEEVRWQLYEAYYDNDMPRLMTDIYYAEGKFSSEFGEELVDLYYYKAKRENDLKAMFTLACAYKHGKGTTQNTTKAVYWLKKLVGQDPNHVLAWLSLYELGEISKDNLLETAKNSNNPKFLKEVKKELGIVEEEQQLTIEEELQLISDLYLNLSESFSLQVYEYCQRHNNLDNLNRLKEKMYEILKASTRSRKMLVAKNVYWVIDAMEQLSGKNYKGEKAAITTMYGTHIQEREWIETTVVEADLQFVEEEEAQLLNCETFEIITIDKHHIQPYLPYLKDGMKVKLHYLRFGTFAGITL